MGKSLLVQCCRPNGSSAQPIDAHRFADICKALAHPARLRIIAHLQKLNRCVCGQIVEALPLAQSTVSQHLKILKEAGVVKGEIEGPRTCYCIDHKVLAEFREMAQLL